MAQLTIRITDIPTNTPENASIFIAGNFNNWAANNPAYQLTQTGATSYEITISPTADNLVFKLTRGTWASVEGNEHAAYLPNRNYNYTGKSATLDIQIQSWEDQGTPENTPSTATENVHLLDKMFYIPQLNRHRHVLIYLPPDYYTSTKRYPVIYAQDGQNIFDAYTSFSGEWEIDESLNALFNQGDFGAIVVGIDNGGADRIDEYSAWAHPTHGGGNAPLYVDFLVNTLKPHIDANYRSQPAREYTSIAGSSMGGLLSIYAAIERQDVFGKAAVFSPSLWFSEQAYTHVAQKGKQANMKIYLLAGQLEDGGSVVAAVQKMYQTLLDAGFSPEEIFVDIDADGQHSEWYWQREFPDAYQWLCANVPTPVTKTHSDIRVQIFSNPSQDSLFLSIPETNFEGELKIFALSGKEMFTQELRAGEQQIAIRDWAKTVYFLIVKSGEEVLQIEKIILTE